MKAMRVVAAYLAAVLVTTLLATVLQTQFNLSQLGALGVEVPLEARLRTTAQDVIGFGPAFGALTAVGFLIAFLVTLLLLRLLGRARTFLYTLAGATAVTAIILIMNTVFDVIVVSAARTPAGFLSLVLTGAVGGYLMARLTRIYARSRETVA